MGSDNLLERSDMSVESGAKSGDAHAAGEKRAPAAKRPRHARRKAGGFNVALGRAKHEEIRGRIARRQERNELAASMPLVKSNGLLSVNDRKLHADGKAGTGVRSSRRRSGRGEAGRKDVRIPRGGRREEGLDKERGSTLPLVIVAAVVLVALLALAFDFGGQLVVAERNNSNMQICREQLNQTASGFLIKNSSDPGKKIAETVVDSLRDQGFDGQVAVYVAEAPRKYSNGGTTLPDTRRLISIKIVMLDQSTALFSRVSGVKYLPVSTDMTFSIMPYSAFKTWRPNSTSSVTKSCYISESGQRTIKSGRVESLSMNNGYTSDKIWSSVMSEMNSMLKYATV